MARASVVEWLLHEASEARPLRMAERTAIDDETWCATIERLEIDVGLRVFLTDVETRRDIAVEAHDNRTDRWVGNQVTVAGRAEIDFLDGCQTHTHAARALIFRPSGRRATYSLAAGTRFRSVGYGLEVARLERLFDGAVPAPLRPLFEAEVEVSRIVGLRADRPLRNAAARLFAPGLNGPLRRLMMEGAVLQLLALQAAAVAKRALPRSRPALTPAERRVVEEAHALLLADMRAPPTLGELASAVGLSEKRLNHGFRAQYGATAFQVLRNERLDHARDVLEMEALPLKQVAFRVGYNHVSNFVSAFSARFGVPPGRLRSRAR